MPPKRDCSSRAHCARDDGILEEAAGVAHDGGIRQLAPADAPDRGGNVARCRCQFSHREQFLGETRVREVRRACRWQPQLDRRDDATVGLALEYAVAITEPTPLGRQAVEPARVPVIDVARRQCTWRLRRRRRRCSGSVRRLPGPGSRRGSRARAGRDRASSRRARPIRTRHRRARWRDRRRCRLMRACWHCRCTRQPSNRSVANKHVAARAEHHHGQALQRGFRQQRRQHGRIVHGGKAVGTRVEMERVPVVQRHVPRDRIRGGHRSFSRPVSCAVRACGGGR